MRPQPVQRGPVGPDPAVVHSLLRDIAHRLETNRPDAPFAQVGRLAIIQATTMSPPLAAALRGLAPEIHTPTTRAAYAALLREIVGAA